MEEVNFSKDLSIEQSHRFVEYRAEQSSYSSSSGGFAQINVDIPLSSGEYVDFEDCRLIFDLTIDGTTGASYPYTASAWMERFYVRTRNQTDLASQTNFYNRWVRSQKELLSSTDNKTSWEAVMEGAQPLSEVASSSAYERAHKPMSNVFTFEGYYPGWAHQGFQINIDLASASAMGSTATSYTVANLRFECRLVKLKPEVHNAVLEQLQSPEGIIFDFESTEATQKTVDSSTSVVYQLGRVSNKLKRVEALEYTTGDIGNFQRNNITDYRYRLGSEFSTPSPIQVSATKVAKHILHYLRAHKIGPAEMNLYGDASNTETLLASTKFVMSHQYDRDKSDDVVSSADSKGMDLELHLTRSASATAGNLYLFKLEDRRLQILPGGVVQMLS